MSSDLTPEQKDRRVRFGLLARSDLVLFAVLNNPDPLAPLDVLRSRYQWKEHHYLIADKLQRVESGEIKALEIEQPPRTSKSEMAVRNFVSWHAGKHPDKDLLIVTATYELAQEHGRDVRDYMNGSGYRLVFGNNPKAMLRSDSQSVDRLQLVGGGKIQFYSRGSIPAGIGAFGIVFDDFFKSAEEANSSTERDKAWRSYVADCLSRLNNSDSWIIVIGSRKHQDDVQGRLFDPTNVNYDERTAKKFVRLRIPALSEGKDSDPLGREKGEAFWPERFPKEFYEAKRDSKSEAVRIDFETQDQCNPTPEQGDYFKKEDLMTYKPESLPKNLRRYASSDHALRKKQKNDSTVLLDVGIDSQDRIYILPTTYWGKCKTDEMVERMIDIMERGQTQMWWAARDQISGSIEPFLRKRMKERRVFRPFDDSISETVDLVQRARSIQARFQMKMVYLPEGWPQLNDAMRQLLSFPNGANDDFIAALAMLGMGLDRQLPADGVKKADIPAKWTWGWHTWKPQETKTAVGWV